MIVLPPMATTALRDGDLLLRPMRPSDTDALHDAGQAEDIGVYTSIAWPFTREAAVQTIDDAARDWQCSTAARFAIVQHPGTPDELFAGTASLLHIYPERSDAEVGYWLAIAGRGRGLARRAVLLLCGWGFETLGLRRLHLMVDLPNEASHAVGFRPTVEELWRHPTDPSKDAVVLGYERLAP